jgi:hypothetical protein
MNHRGDRANSNSAREAGSAAAAETDAMLGTCASRQQRRDRKYRCRNGKAERKDTESKHTDSLLGLTVFPRRLLIQTRSKIHQPQLDAWT